MNSCGLHSKLTGGVTIRKKRTDGVSYKSGEGQIKKQIKGGLAFGQIKVSTGLFIRLVVLVIDDVLSSSVLRV